MPDKIANYVVMQSSDTGTANLQLSSHDAGRYRDFLDEYSSGGTDVFKYTIVHQDPPGDPELEFGTGHINGSGDLVRDTVIDSSNNDNPVNFSSGKKIVSNRLDAIRMLRKPVRETDTDVTTNGSETILTNLGAGATFDGSFEESASFPDVEGETINIRDMSFSPDGQRLAIITDDSVGVYIFSTDDWSVERILKEDSTHGIAVEFSPQGNFIAFSDRSLGTDEDYAVFETDTWSQVATLNGNNVTDPDIPGVPSLSFFPDDGKLATSGTPSSRTNLGVWLTGTWGIDQDLSASDNLAVVSVSTDGSMIASGIDQSSPNNGLYVWSTSPSFSIDFSIGSSVISTRAVTVEFSEDNQLISIGGNDDILHIVEVDSESVVQTLTNATGNIQDSSWSDPDNNLIAYCAFSPNELWVYNTDDWTLNSTLTQASTDIRTTSFSPLDDVIVYGENSDTFFIHTGVTPSAPTITLESDDASLDGVKVTIKDNEGFANQFPITIDTEGSETIDGLSSIELDEFEGVTEIISFNGNWVEL